MLEATPRELEDRPRILVVDDDEDIREVVASILKVEGYEVDVACDGRQALDHVMGAQPSLILLDLMMPVMDGRAFLREIDQREALAQIPVVIFTAFAERDDRSLMRPILRKPLNVNELIGTVAGFCEPGWHADEPPTERRPTPLDQ